MTKHINLILIITVKVVFAVNYNEYFHAEEEQQYKNHVLDSSYASYVVDLNYQQNYTAEKFYSSDKNSILLFSNSLTKVKVNLTEFLLYDGFNMSYGFIGNIDNMNAMIPSKSGCFILYRTTRTYATSVGALFTILPIQYKNCNGPNVFDISAAINITSTSNGPCDIVILSPNFIDISESQIRIKDIKTDAKSIIFKSAKNNKILYNSNSSTTQTWKNICIYAKSLLISIPFSSNLQINMYAAISSYIDYEGGLQKGIMASPSYSGFSQPLIAFKTLYNIISDKPMAVVIFVKELTGICVTFDDSVATNDINLEYNKTYYFETTNLELKYNQTFKSDNFLMEYSISHIRTTTTPRSWTTSNIKSKNTSISAEGLPNVTKSTITNSEASVSKSKFPVIYIIIGSIVIICLIIASGICIGRRIFYTRKRNQLLRHVLANMKEEKQKTKKEFCFNEINSRNLLIDYTKVLGKGSTSSVYLGSLKNSYNNKVAVKIGTNATPDDTDLFSKELLILSALPKHSNIITFFGWSFLNNIPAIIIELAKSDLLVYIRSLELKNLAIKDMIKMFIQICNALDYLAQHDIIHRDVACRNILLFDNFVVKLSDFGLCCHANNTPQQYIPSIQKRFPLRWLSYEALSVHKFSEKSDIWAFGILCYEIFTYGKIPYETIANEEILGFLETENRLEKPENCPEIIYGLMMECWKKLPGDRPTFSELYEILKKLMELETVNYGYLELEDIK